MNKEEAIQEAQRIGGICLEVIANWNQKTHYLVLRGKQEVRFYRKFNRDWDFTITEIWR